MSVDIVTAIEPDFLRLTASGKYFFEDVFDS